MLMAPPKGLKRIDDCRLYEKEKLKFGNLGRLCRLPIAQDEIKGFRCRIFNVNATEIWNFRPWNLSLRSLKLEFQSNFRPVHVGTTTQKWNMFLSINSWPINKYQIVKFVLHNRNLKLVFIQFIHVINQYTAKKLILKTYVKSGSASTSFLNISIKSCTFLTWLVPNNYFSQALILSWHDWWVSSGKQSYSNAIHPLEDG